jgi:penicillin-binding protein activator
MRNNVVPVIRQLLLAAPVIGLAACATPGAVQTTSVVDPRADRSAIGAGLDMRDFENAAGDAVQKMLASPQMTKPDGGRYVIAISRVTNDTMQRIDTDLLIKRIRVELLNSGKATITTTIGLDGVEDPLVMQTRQLRHSAEFNQAQVARAGQMLAPDLSLSGKIIQLNNRLGDGSQRVDYAFQLTVTDVNTGVSIWEGDTPISKVMTNRTVSW